MGNPVYITASPVIVEAFNKYGLQHLLQAGVKNLPEFVGKCLTQFEPRPVVYVDVAGEYLGQGLFEDLDCDFAHREGAMYFANNQRTRRLCEAWEKEGPKLDGVFAAIDEVEGVKVEHLD